MRTSLLLVVTRLLSVEVAVALNIVIPGGTGPVGRSLASSLPKEHSVTILCRNAFLAAAPNRVSGDFGWLGESFLRQHRNVRLRDWDGGDLLDIVGCDWMGWPEDALTKADIVVNLVGGYTEQRVMATERIIRESLRLNPQALQIAVSPTEDELRKWRPGATTLKLRRIKTCEDTYRANCAGAVCLQAEFNDVETLCADIRRLVAEYE